MFKALRLASAALLVGLFGVASQGCIVGECKSGQENCIQIQAATIWEGTPVTRTLTYTAGKNIRVDGVNGQVTLIRGTSTSQISVKFTPFSIRAGDEETLAQQDMQKDLILTTTDTAASEVLIQTDRTANGSGGLGADIEVTLPSGFDGGVEVDSGNGSIDADLSGGNAAFTTMNIPGAGDITVVGASGKLSITGPFGVDVQIQNWSAVDASTILGDRDMTIRIAPGLSGQIEAISGASGVVTGPTDTAWTETATAPNHKSFVFGTNGATAPVLSASIDSFTFANITIIQE